MTLMKTDGPPLPFKTTDAILATCLRMVGVPMWVPPMNVYDEAILKRLGYRNMTLREAGIAADKDKARGRVEYLFEKTQLLDDYLKIYAEQEKEITAEGNDMDAGERIRQIMALATRQPEDRPDIAGPLMDEREALLRSLCITLKSYVPFKNQWKEWTSWLEIEKGAKESVKIDANTTRYFPGTNRVPVNASDKMLKDLKLL